MIRSRTLSSDHDPQCTPNLICIMMLYSPCAELCNAYGMEMHDITIFICSGYRSRCDMFWTLFRSMSSLGNIVPLDSKHVAICLCRARADVTHLSIRGGYLTEMSTDSSWMYHHLTVESFYLQLLACPRVSRVSIYILILMT
jgi:hypothetical protein